MPEPEDVKEIVRHSKKDWTTWVTAIALILTVSGLVASVVSYFPLRPVSIGSKLQEERFELISETVRDQQRRLAEMEAKIASVSVPTNDKKTALELADIKNSLARLQDSSASLEKVILDDPTKAVSLPLLRKDVENLKTTQQSESASLNKEIERVYDLNKWLVGIMFTMALGVISLAISSFWKGRKPQGTTSD